MIKHSLEHSQYSEDHNLFAYHIEPLESAIRRNLIDSYHNNRGANKWQITFIGTQQACQAAMDAHMKNKSRMETNTSA